jgi:hypothetical protein
MGGSLKSLGGVVAGLGGRVLARRRVPIRVSGRGLARAVIERRRPSYLPAATRLARGRSLGLRDMSAADSAVARGLSEFAARWLFGDGPPEGIPFSDAAAQAALARMSHEAALPSFLQKSDDTEVATDGDEGERQFPIARGRVEEVSSYRLSRTPARARREPSQARRAPGPQAGVDGGLDESPPSTEPPDRGPASPEAPGDRAGGQAPVPPSRLVVRRGSASEATPERPSLRVRRVSRTPPAPPAQEPDVASPRRPSRGLRVLDRLFHAVSSGPAPALDRHVQQSAPSVRGLLRVVRHGPSNPTGVRPEAASFQASRLRRLFPAAAPATAPDGSAPEVRSNRPGLEVALHTASRSREPGGTEIPTRPRVAVAGRIHRPVDQSSRSLARTSGLRLAAAAGAPLVPDSDGTATVVFAPTALDAAPSLSTPVSAASTPSIFRFPDSRSATGAALALAPEEPAGMVAGPELLDLDAIYEQVVERLRRELLAERERMGDLLGDLRR